MRIWQIGQALDEESWIGNLKKYLNRDISEMDAGEAKTCGNLSPEDEIDHNDLLYFCPMAKRDSEGCDGIMRLVVPETMQQGFLHHYHTSMEGGH